MTSPEERLADLGLTVPSVVPPVAAYVPAARTGSLVFTAGQVPMRDGELVATGKVGGEVSIEQATECAQQCALNAIAAVKAEIGDLAKVRRVVKAVVFVASTPDFTGQPGVANGASELLAAAFGDAGSPRPQRRRCGIPAARQPGRGRDRGRGGLMRIPDSGVAPRARRGRGEARGPGSSRRRHDRAGA